MVETNQNWKNWVFHFVVFLSLVAFYTATRPLNHAESYDGITYSLIAENYSLGTARDSRNILFHAVNRTVFVASQWAGLGLRALEVTAFFNVVTAALALLLFKRLLRVVYGVASFTAWFGAGFLGLTYGFWRYAGETEVYVPSIFLILCSLTLLFRYLDQTGDEAVHPKPHNKTVYLVLAGVVAGSAVLFYQANLIALFVATIVLFRWSRFSGWVSYGGYSLIGVLVVCSGIVWSCACVCGHFPSVEELNSFMTERNSEFPEPTGFLKTVLKSLLAFGHDVFSAHWTRTLDPVREILDPYIPGCVYNFNVASFAGRGLQAWTAIAAILFVPLLIMLGRFFVLASKQWVWGGPGKPMVFMLLWTLLTTLMVGSLGPGSFEAWIPMLIPFTVLLTVFVFEPCRRVGMQKSLIVFLVLFFCYNFFGGMLIWRNPEGDLFEQQTAWIRQELTEEDTVLLNEFDFRIIDYLCYYSEARVAHLLYEDRVVIHRTSPEIYMVPLEEFLAECKSGEGRLVIMGDVLSPSQEIKNCKEGQRKFAAASKLANQLKPHARLVDESPFGDTFEVFPKSEDSP